VGRAVSDVSAHLLHLEGGTDHDRNLAAALQQGASALVAGIPTAGTGGTCLADRDRGANATSKLTFYTDHLAGAGQPRGPQRLETEIFSLSPSNSFAWRQCFEIALVNCRSG